MSIPNVLTSDINLGLPLHTDLREPLQLREEMQAILNAFRVLQIEFAAVKTRLDALEAYNIAHP